MPSPIERELHSHSAALRALARALVGAQHADDLVQDTAVQALQSPPHRPGPLGGWLASIVRHLASKHRRSEHRRRRREQLAARPESQPPDLAGDDRDAFRRLTQAVLALPEPYQTTLLLRYLRGLTPTQIAATTREPLRTVKTRLQRGLALLRADLDRDGRDWRRAFAAAFGLERLATTAAITTGVLLMGTGAKVVMGGAAATAALAATLWLAGDDAPETGITAGAGDQQRVAAAAATIASAHVAPAEPSAREIASPRPSADPSLATFRGRCVDEHGLPLAGGAVHLEARTLGEGFLVDAAVWPPPADQTTADDGLFAFHFPVDASMRFHLSLRHGDRSERTGAWTDIAEGQVVDLGDVALLPTVVVTGRVVDTRNRPQAGVRIVVRRLVVDDAVLSQCNERDAVSGIDGTFGPLPLPAPSRARVAVDRRLVDGPYHHCALVPGRSMQLELVVASTEDLPPIRGVVVDETGQPLPDASVMLKGIGGGRVAADGTFALHAVSGEGPFLVLANANGFEGAQSGPHALGTTDVRIVLRRLPGLLVRVRAADTGEPVHAFAVHLVTVGTLGWRHSCQSHEHLPDGVANVRAIEKGDHFVHVDPGHGPLASGTFVPVTIGDAQTTEVEVLLPRRCRRLLRLRADDGAPLSAPVSATVELIDTTGLPSQLEAEARGLVAWDRLAGLSSAVEVQHGEADANGELMLDGPASHDLALRLRGPGIAPQTVAPVRLDRDGPLDVAVQRGATWTGRLVPADVAAELFVASQPQPGQQDDGALGIELARPQADDRSPQLLHLLDTACTCDAEGRFHIAGIPAGTWQVVVQALGRRYHCDEITVGNGSTLERDLDVANLRLAALDLQVVVEGTPLAHGTIYVIGEHALDHAGKRFVIGRTKQLDASGRVELCTFAGVLTFHVGSGAGTLFAPQLTVTAGGRVQQVLDVRRAAVSLRLVTAAGRPAAGVAVQIGSVHGFRAVTDAEGRIATDVVAAGRHSLRARRRSGAADAPAATQDGWTDLGPIDIAPGANAEATFRLPPEWDR